MCKIQRNRAYIIIIIMSQGCHIFFFMKTNKKHVIDIEILSV